ncbi:predicted protein [Uncinocarpus reesii 1704]|uniref:RecA family profile 1 domain-containing protein n=1 Tax=Uncinocarpus reesii (strain UAMH 1704) TaxID=336963 RepID=C4JFT2_UNCRE|nr:uncharacterized protein UREG_02416 [Uncinocarpus reesii 1704]EEP77567.1 predicted protein [Uncinocarpus reesii 1704]
MTTEDTANFSSPDSPRRRSLRDAPHVKFGLVPVLEEDSSLLQNISTGLPRLDLALSLPAEPRPSPLGLGLSRRYVDGNAGADDDIAAGVRRGEVTEIVGPKGQERRCWHTAGPICISRLQSILRERRERSPAEGEPSLADNKFNLEKLLHFRPASLAHLIALLSHPPRGFPPKSTGLIVVDSISCPFAAEFRPRLPKRLRGAELSHAEQTKLEKESSLYFSLIGSILSDLRRLAIRLNCATVVIHEMGSRVKTTRQPMLHEVISGFTWDAGIASSILLYWHWLPWRMRKQTGMKRVRIAEVRKIGGAGLAERSIRRIVPFTVEVGGPREILDEDSIAIAVPASQNIPDIASEKRKFDGMDSTPSHRLKVEPTIVITGPDDGDDDDEILDPLPGANEEDYEVPDSESDFERDDLISDGSNHVESETEILFQTLQDDSYLYD